MKILYFLMLQDLSISNEVRTEKKYNKYQNLIKIFHHKNSNQKLSFQFLSFYEFMYACQWSRILMFLLQKTANKCSSYKFNIQYLKDIRTISLCRNSLKRILVIQYMVAFFIKFYK